MVKDWGAGTAGSRREAVMARRVRREPRPGRLEDITAALQGFHGYFILCRNKECNMEY